MSGGMANAEWFDATKIALRDFEGASDAVLTMQIEEIHELFQKAQEWESLNRQVKTLKANKMVEGLGSGESPQVKEWFVMIEGT